MVDYHLIEELVQLRKQKGLTQSALAQRMGIPQSSVARVESAKTDVGLSRFVDMARLLDYELLLVPKELATVIHALIASPAEFAELLDSPAYSTDKAKEDNAMIDQTDRQLR